MAASVSLAAAANLPDVDLLAGLMSREDGILLESGITHSLPGILVLGFLLAFALWKLFAGRRLVDFFLLSLAGATAHVGLDLLGSEGGMMLYPFSRERIAWNWFAQADPVLWAIPGVGVIVAQALRSWGAALGRASLAGIACYAVFCAMSHATAETRFQDSLGRLGIRPAEIAAYPGSSGPLVWNVVARFSAPDDDSPGRYYQGNVHMLHGLKGRMRMYLDRPTPAWVDASLVDSYRLWAAAPVLRFVTTMPKAGVPGNPEVALYDLRFMGNPKGMPHVVRLGVSGSGRPEKEWMAGYVRPPEADQEFQLP